MPPNVVFWITTGTNEIKNWHIVEQRTQNYTFGTIMRSQRIIIPRIPQHLNPLLRRIRGKIVHERHRSTPAHANISVLIPLIRREEGEGKRGERRGDARCRRIRPAFFTSPWIGEGGGGPEHVVWCVDCVARVVIWSVDYQNKPTWQGERERDERFIQ